MADKMFLYWGSGSTPCWRPMIVLEEKGLSGYPNKLVSFSSKEHKGEDVMKLNPRGQVPTFKDGDLIINESVAICQYLESKYKDQGTKLIPDSDGERAKVLQRMFESLNIQKFFNENLIVYQWRTKPENQDKALLKERCELARTEIGLWENYLKQIGDSQYIVGKNFTMADVFLFTHIAFLVRSGLNLDKYPAIGAYYTFLKDRPSIQASWPPHWKDSENQTLVSDV